MGTSLGILATVTIASGILINGTELSYLNNATSNIQDQITNINNNLTDLNLKTTEITYNPSNFTTSFGSIVNLLGQP